MENESRNEYTPTGLWPITRSSGNYYVAYGEIEKELIYTSKIVEELGYQPNEPVQPGSAYDFTRAGLVLLRFRSRLIATRRFVKLCWMVHDGHVAATVLLYVNSGSWHNALVTTPRVLRGPLSEQELLK